MIMIGLLLKSKFVKNYLFNYQTISHKEMAE